MEYNTLLMVIPLLLTVALVFFVVHSLRKGELNLKITAILVAIIVVAVVAIPIISADHTTTTAYDNVVYDDYIRADVTSATGSVEAVTVGGQKYIHACGLGNGSAKLSNGDTYTFDVKKCKLNVFLLWGQSNAEYRTYSDTTYSEYPCGIGYYYGVDSYPVSILYSGTNYDFYDISNTTTGIQRFNSTDSAFAKEYYNQTHEKVYVINAGIGGKSVTEFIPNGTMYTYAADIFDGAMDAIDTDYYTPVLQSYIWIQGEKDTSMAVSTYCTNFMLMHNALTTANTFTDYGAFKSALISKVRSVNGVNSSTAQIQLANDYTTVHLATALSDTFSIAGGTMASDNIHYTTTARNMIGVAIAQYCANLS